MNSLNKQNNLQIDTDKDNLFNNLKTKFNNIFQLNDTPRFFFAPGRVNLIGEHTDYNGGHVFPCAISMGTYALVSPRMDNKISLYSLNFEDKGIITESIDSITYKEENNWANYPLGIFKTLLDKGYTIDKGLNILFYGTLPNSSGLSSSASIEVLTGFIINKIFNLNIKNENLAVYSQYSENNFNKVNCGIMDQFSIAMGKENNAIYLDTNNLTYEYVPLNLDNYKIVIMCTNKKRSLSDSKYNERRSECEKALSKLKSCLNINSLGEIDELSFIKYAYLIDDEILIKRARHAVTENERTLNAKKALANNDIKLFGKLMVASHNSLKEDYEITGLELDTIVESALKQKGVCGARMTGAGFGGCAIALVNNDFINEFIENVGNEYKNKIGYEASFFIASTGNGPYEYIPKI